METYQIIQLIVSSLGVVVNVMTLLALCQIRSRLMSPHRFIISLACSDILLSITLMFTVGNQQLRQSLVEMSIAQNSTSVSVNWLRLYRCTQVISKSFHSCGQAANLLTLAGMAFDHYLIIAHSMWYTSDSRKRKAGLIVVLLWIISALVGFSDIILSLFKQSDKAYQNNIYCEIVLLTLYQEELLVFALALVCAVFIITNYCHIFRRLQHSVNEDNYDNFRRVSKRTDLIRKKRAVNTTLMILVAFTVCWMPMILLEVALVVAIQFNTSMHIHHKQLLAVGISLQIVFMCNVLLDPLIYAFRNREIRLGYGRLFNLCRYTVCRKVPTSGLVNQH